MNKYIILIILAVVIIGGGIAYRVYLLPQKSVPVTSGKTREITITAKKDQWRFDPEVIEVDRGDKVILHMVNEDNYDHGVAIDKFGISQRMGPNATTNIEFVATQEGDFPLYCSVPCGEGEVDGKHRGHVDMVGKLHVRSIISGTK